MRALRAGATNARSALPTLRDDMQFTDDEMAETIPSGTRERVFDRADWALFHLMKGGLIDRPRRGHYVLSSEGAAYLAAGHDALSRATLEAIPQYAAFKAATRDASQLASPKPAGVQQDTTPLELIATSLAVLDAETASELRALLLEVSPSRFERIIVDLLIAMGYGGGDPAMGQSIGRSGDGGIDGVINEDALGLDAVYIQAKRYAVENKVGRPALQAFVGSLTGEGANKGVFVTTSDFSSEARAYVERVQQRIVLINGDRLARLMIQHGVGVRPRQTYVIRSVDEDYFSDI